MQSKTVDGVDDDVDTPLTMPDRGGFAPPPPRRHGGHERELGSALLSLVRGLLACVRVRASSPGIGCGKEAQRGWAARCRCEA